VDLAELGRITSANFEDLFSRVKEA